MLRVYAARHKYAGIFRAPIHGLLRNYGRADITRESDGQSFGSVTFVFGLKLIPYRSSEWSQSRYQLLVSSWNERYVLPMLL